ncbi:hypothetical protein HORIV_35560 [Vreelandella olivaria]|uniref:Uncharacterized protein n=1 Tax=Vreelandella olivaria TaxID=390919 RepID=A0ABN5WXL3_9GAMM|nr:hypothetical protein HORIV_35560 [Halomonas olivaria]
MRFPDSAKAQDMQAISNKLAFLVQVHLSKKEALIEKLIGQLDQLYIDTNLHASSGFENRASATKYFQFLGSLVSSISVTLNTIAKAAVAEAKRLS